MAEWHSHGFVNVEDPHGRWWRYVRFHRWWSNVIEVRDPEPDARGNVRRRDVGWSIHVGGELLHAPTSLNDLYVKVSTTGEETLDVAYGLGPILRHYWSLEVSRNGRQLRIPIPVRFTLNLGVTRVSWCFGPGDHGWSRGASWPERLRRNDLKWWRVGRYGDQVEVLDETDVLVPFPEGEYPVHLTLQRRTWTMRVGPYSLTRNSPWWCDFRLPIWKRVEYEVDWRSEHGIPVPDKNGGDDAIFASGVRVPARAQTREWVNLAVAGVIKCVNDQRVRHGRDVRDTGRR